MITRGCQRRICFVAGATISESDPHLRARELVAFPLDVGRCWWHPYRVSINEFPPTQITASGTEQLGGSPGQGQIVQTVEFTINI